LLGLSNALDRQQSHSVSIACMHVQQQFSLLPFLDTIFATTALGREVVRKNSSQFAPRGQSQSSPIFRRDRSLRTAAGAASMARMDRGGYARRASPSFRGRLLFTAEHRAPDVGPISGRPDMLRARADSISSGSGSRFAGVAPGGREDHRRRRRRRDKEREAC